MTRAYDDARASVAAPRPLLTLARDVSATKRLIALSFGARAHLGVLVLIGIMAKKGILMVEEFADQLRDEGRTAVEAAREASLVRLRPIAMTIISTVLAGLPLILSAGPGSESREAIG